MERLKAPTSSSSSSDDEFDNHPGVKPVKRPMSTGSDYSPLYEAAEKGDVETLSRLIHSGNVNLNGKSGGHGVLRTALHGAAGYGQYQATSLLLKAGADPHCQSDSGRTPLHEACAGGHVDVVQVLLKYMTDTDAVDCHKQTAAHAAAFHGEVDCLRLLIGCGTDMDITDKDGYTVAHLAAIRNHPGIIRCLIEEDADLNSLDRERRTPAHLAAMSGGLETLKVLAHNDLDVNTKDVDGCVPAHCAALHGHLPCMQFLVMAGLTKLEVRDRTGRGLLHMAAIRGSTDCLHWLLERNVNPNMRDGEKRLQKAGDWVKDLPTLLKGSAITPSHYAASGGHAECIGCLLKHDAEIDAPTPQGLTPLVFAKKAGKAIPFEDAVSGKTLCPFCVAKQQQIEYDLAHEPTPVEKSIADAESVIFTPTQVTAPSPENINTTTSSRIVSASARSTSSKKLSKSSSNLKQKSELPKRDLAAKYFGEHLFSLPEALRTQSPGKNTTKIRGVKKAR